MKLFSKSKPGAPSAAGATPTFQPIDRVNLLGLLDRIVNQGDSCVLRVREPRGAWTYAFQGGGLTHASGGAVRGARQAFDLLWEFQQGEVSVTAGVDPTLSSNLYIDKGRLLDLLRRSQGALSGPGSPYIPPDQQRPVQPVRQPWPQPGMAPRPAGPPPGWSPTPYPPPQGYPAAPPPGYPAGAPQRYPAAPPGGHPAAPPPGYPAAYPAPPGYPTQPGIQPPGGPHAQPGAPWPGYPGQPSPTPQPYPPAAGQPMAPPPPMATPAPRPRPVTPPSFSVPPMPLPKPRGTVNLPPPTAPPRPTAPAPVPQAAPGPVTPVDELKNLRASLVSQAPAVPVSGQAPNWNLRGQAGPVPPPAAPARGKRQKVARRPGRLRSWGRVRLITFLLWACERKYSPDDHWTVKDAFEVATLELRDQFLGAFSQSFQAAKRPAGPSEFEGDQIASGRTRGRTRARKR